jgi:uncharacterized protein YdhG (YjbR/CyaY superfamily)
MENTMSAKTKQESTKSTTSTAKSSKGFTAEEKAAMKERARELKAAKNAEEAEAEVLAKIAEMPEPDRSMGNKLHKMVKDNAPELAPRTWYGMPAYANKDGKVLCFFQNADKFKVRYSTFNFTEEANLDDGDMWPIGFALGKLTSAELAKLGKLVKQAVTEPSPAK